VAIGLIAISIDGADIGRLAQFWADVLDQPVNPAPPTATPRSPPERAGAGRGVPLNPQQVHAQQEGRAVTNEIKGPDADHPITIVSDTARVVARVGGTVIGDTNAALTLREAWYPPVHYIPVDEVVPGTLRPSRSHSYCPYKGDASYYDVVTPDGTELRDVAWTYATPYPAVDAIAGRVAFYTDRVQIEADTVATDLWSHERQR
jgi:uncharacterized protein (DUF427 family)